MTAKENAMQTLPDLARSMQKFKLLNKLTTCRSTVFGDSIRDAVNNNKPLDAISMVHDQLRGGNTGEVEWCIGASTLQLLLDLYPMTSWEMFQLKKYGNIIHQKEPQEWNGMVRDYRAEQREAEEQQYDQP